MDSFYLTVKPPKTIQRMDWSLLPSGHWQCGSVQIRLVSFEMVGDYRLEQWGLWSLSNGRWYQCYCKSRKWLYGSPGQAKCGISKVGELIFGDPLIDLKRR